MDGDFANAGTCHTFTCTGEVARRKRSEEDAEQLTTLTVSLSDGAASNTDGGFPIWIIIVAVVGGIVLLLAIAVLAYVVVSKRKNRNAWEKY